MGRQMTNMPYLEKLRPHAVSDRYRAYVVGRCIREQSEEAKKDLGEDWLEQILEQEFRCAREYGK